jgi:hypothetical protein
MARLPQPGGDQDTWGDVLNNFLSVELNPDGTLKKAGDIAAAAPNDSVIHNSGDETIAGNKTFSSSPIVPTPSTSTAAANKSYVDSTASAGAPDATTTSKGIVKLAGDLGGTADLPTVPGLSGKESTITAGTTSQYYRGDKSFQTLDKAAVGLANADNTSDANKPVSSATTTALNLKVDKSAATTKGDLLAATAASTIARVGVGTDGQVLTADSASTPGVTWATPASATVTSVVGQTGVITGAQIASDVALSGTYTHWNGASLTQAGSTIPIGSGSGAGTYLFAAQTASIAVSAAISISSAITLGQCRLSCTGAPAGSNLVVILQASADGGPTWTDAQQLSIIDGTTAAQTANPAYAVNPNSLLRVNCTSSGSGTAATGVLFQVDYA